MPGSKEQWYAMRKRLQKAGKWTHKVPEKEEGEPPEKRSREEEDPEEGQGDGIPPADDPEEGTSHRARGMYTDFYAYSLQMAAFGSANGFSLLLWVDYASPLWTSTQTAERADLEKQLLQDAVCLLGTRWNMDFQFHETNGILYAFGVCPRFTVGVQTIARALGDLSMHVKFNRGTGTDVAASLIRYKECKEKYNVPDVVSEGSSGQDNQETQPGSYWQPKKRK